MKNLNRQNRRSFLKTNAVIGIGALSGGISLTGCSSSEPAKSGSGTAEALRMNYLECLGGPFPDPVPLKPEVREVMPSDGYRIESVTYEVQSGERVPALLMIPDDVSASNPRPAVAVWHQHNGEFHLGKSEPAGLAGNPMHHTGLALVKEGYVVLCPDTLCFEERQDPTGKLKGAEYERFEFLREVVRGRCLAWRNILDMKRAVDYLCERPEVQKDKIGCYGHSMGSTNAWLVGPLEPRLKCVVGNCCLPTYEAIEETHILHAFANFVPGWMKFGDTPEIAGLIAPRALHLNFGEKDWGSPIESVRRGLTRISEQYKNSGSPENFTFFIEAGKEHELSEAMWQHVKEVLEHHLKVKS